MLGWRKYLTIASVVILVLLVLFILLVSSDPETKGYPHIADIEKALGIASAVTAEEGIETQNTGKSFFNRKFAVCFCMWFLCMGLYNTFTAWSPKVFEIKGWVSALILAVGYAMVGFAPSPAVATVSAVIVGIVAYFWNAPYIGLLGNMAPAGKLGLVMFALCLFMHDPKSKKK